jgi:predicted GIY-YIG superfamily endonuclease
MESMNYIYLMQSLENSYYKIGVSKSPNLRIKQLNTGNPELIKLIEVYQSNIAYEIEKVLHRRYSHARKNNEWFDLSISDEVNFIKNCERIDESIKYLKKSGNAFI